MNLNEARIWMERRINPTPNEDYNPRHWLDEVCVAPQKDIAFSLSDYKHRVSPLIFKKAVKIHFNSKC